MTTNSTIEFTVTEEHLKLLRNAWVRWDNVEFGAPGIDSKRPYGNSDVLGDIVDILGLPETATPDQIRWMMQLHVETSTVLQIALRTGVFETGTYVADKYSQDWHKKVA